MYFVFKSIYYTIQLHFHFLKNSFTGYEYIGFQFSKHDEYAQRICISNFQIYCFKKNYKNLASHNKINMTKSKSSK
jgi:hypothetical protein